MIGVSCHPGALPGNHKMTRPQAAAAAQLFGLSKTGQAMLNEVPMRGAGAAMPPTDPLIDCFTELVRVNGAASQGARAFSRFAELDGYPTGLICDFG